MNIGNYKFLKRFLAFASVVGLIGHIQVYAFDASPAYRSDVELTSSADQYQCDPGQVCRHKETRLPLRAFPRSYSKIYQTPNPSSSASNARAFWPLYVFAMQDLDYSDPVNPQGWYQVGTSHRNPSGWMQAKDVMEWKQAIVVSYSHPGIEPDMRNPVLMFKDKQALDDLVNRALDAPNEVENLYADIETGQFPPEVISREPSCFVDIEEPGNFYVIPVINYEEVDYLDEPYPRYLQLAMAVPQERADAQKPDILRNLRFSEKACKVETKTLGFDIKFVMDMTSSMGPYIQRTKDAIRDIATKIRDQNLDAEVNFGLIGYRDSLSTEPHQTFEVKNFNRTVFDSEQLVSAEDFLTVIDNAEETKNPKGDYAEAVDVGIKTAIESGWGENTRHFIVLVGDASMREVGDNSTGMNVWQLRQLAGEGTRIFAFHLKAPGFETDHAKAEAQFSALATNPGSEELPFYQPINAEKDEDYQILATVLTDMITNDLNTVRGGGQLEEAPSFEEVLGMTDPVDRVRSFARIAVSTSLMSYFGKETTPPRDITPWVIDRDLNDLDLRSLQVRVLLRKRELNDLVIAVETLLAALRKAGEMDEMQFFEALQSTVTTSMKGERLTVQNAEKLADSGLLPSWINTLPYRSPVLNLSNDRFERLSAEERATLELEVESKLNLYKTINESADAWIALDETDDRLDYVYPLVLDALP